MQLAGQKGADRSRYEPTSWTRCRPGGKSSPIPQSEGSSPDLKTWDSRGNLVAKWESDGVFMGPGRSQLTANLELKVSRPFVTMIQPRDGVPQCPSYQDLRPH